MYLVFGLQLINSKAIPVTISVTSTNASAGEKSITQIDCLTKYAYTAHKLLS